MRSRRARSRGLAAGLVAAGMMVPTAARAQSASTQRLFFRMALGGGYGFDLADVAPSGASKRISLRYDGGGALGAFSLGVIVAPGFAVHVDASALALVVPAITVQGMPWPMPVTSDFTTSTSLVGAGFTWHHHSNFWISLSGGVTQLSVELPFERAAGHALTALGGAAQLLVGRDWRVTEHWYVGGALHVLAAMVPEAGFGVTAVPSTWYAGGVGLAITLGTR